MSLSSKAIKHCTRLISRLMLNARRYHAANVRGLSSSILKNPALIRPFRASVVCVASTQKAAAPHSQLIVFCRKLHTTPVAVENSNGVGARAAKCPFREGCPRSQSRNFRIHGGHLFLLMLGLWAPERHRRRHYAECVDTKIASLRLYCRRHGHIRARGRRHPSHGSV